MSLLVNRMTSRLGMPLEDIETAVGMSVQATFPCKYKGVAKGIRDGKPAPALLRAARELLTKSEATPKSSGGWRLRMSALLGKPAPPQTRPGQATFFRALRSAESGGVSRPSPAAAAKMKGLLTFE